jgi:Zn-dependent peptidase ImmA (M78 family)
MSPPDLAIICSSADGLKRLERLAAGVLSRMDAELAARLARRIMLIGLDGTKHAAFAQGLGGPQDVTLKLANEQVKQNSAAQESLAMICINLDARRHDAGLEMTLAHELGHVALGHTDASAVAAEPLTAEQEEQLEREANRFAARYVAQWGPVDTEL